MAFGGIKTVNNFIKFFKNVKNGVIFMLCIVAFYNWRLFLTFKKQQQT